MRIQIIAASNRQPSWVGEACAEYAKRLRPRVTLTLQDIALGKRGRNEPADRPRADEGRRMLALVPERAHVVALDERGSAWSTGDLVERIDAWSRDHDRICVLLGGPDGFDAAVYERARETWALSRLTLPHGLAKIIALEALYRAFTVRSGHPYHRA